MASGLCLKLHSILANPLFVPSRWTQPKVWFAAPKLLILARQSRFLSGLKPLAVS